MAVRESERMGERVKSENERDRMGERVKVKKRESGRE